VLVLGAANSGQDISAEISRAASKVYLSHNGNRLESKMPDNLSEVSGLVAAEPDGLRLKDGNIISPAPDAIVLATGYHFTLARFLSPSCGIRTANGQVFPLFKNLINPHHPSMFLMGLLNDVAQFPMYHVQALAARAALEGRWRLPGSQEMLRQASEEVERAVRRYGKPRHTHLMRDEQWSYNAELLEYASWLQGIRPSSLPQRSLLRVLDTEEKISRDIP
jgi:cation diffusion facilitator CzcD-associated flavoprotein CzcO